MKKLHNDWKQLDANDKSFFGYAGLFVLGAAFLFWLATTVQPPVVDYPTIDTQTQYKPNYELKGIYKQYAKKIYENDIN